MLSQGRNYYIGTSGWAYEDWVDIFYPSNLASRERLGYYARFFNTTEINYSFYHLPRSNIYRDWYQQTPADFIFAVKVSRFITHIKRLKDVTSAWHLFLKNSLILKEKLGPFLFQFPASFKKTKENIGRLENFLTLATNKKRSLTNRELKFAFEFRHKSWFEENIYALLNKYGAALVIADSSRYPKKEVTTSNFVYFRFHGPTSLFSSRYTNRQLKNFSLLIKEYLRKGKEVFCYFNNDFQGFAIENAKKLLEFLK